MKTPSLYIGRILLFWFILFNLQQAIFLAVHFGSSQLGVVDVLTNFYKGFAMNLATALYLTILPLLLVVIGLFVNMERFINGFTKVYTPLMIILCAWIASVDSGIYAMWGTKITSRALAYMAYPKEVIPTLFTKSNLGLFIILILQIAVMIWLSRKMIKPYHFIQSALFKKIALTFLLLATTFLGIRGGTENVPLNRNWVFYSKHSLLNYAALNGVWNISDLLNKPLETTDNPYSYFPITQADSILVNMQRESKDTTISILNTTRPNIVMVFLESWSADVMECVGGEKGITPKFGELAKEGLLFTNCYATGFRTEQGMLAILSSYPAQPTSSIIKQFGKFDKLPNLYRTLGEQGYHTSFYSGGSLQFDNIEGYLRAAGVDKMVGEKDWTFTKATHWGAYDDETFAMHNKALGELPQPFMSGITTMITHEAFEGTVPVLYNSDANPTNDAYRNSMHYADSCLFLYIKQAQTQPWYQNTLFIIVADHGCRFPKTRNNFEQERHHIPLLLMGGALKKEYTGVQYTAVASHTDIAHTLLAQMHLPSAEYKRSKNLFNPFAPKFAYYAFDNGFGLIAPGKTVIYDHIQQKELSNQSDSLAYRLIQQGKAYLQTNFQENLDYAEIKKPK